MCIYDGSFVRMFLKTLGLQNILSASNLWSTPVFFAKQPPAWGCTTLKPSKWLTQNVVLSNDAQTCASMMDHLFICFSKHWDSRIFYVHQICEAPPLFSAKQPLYRNACSIGTWTQTPTCMYMYACIYIYRYIYIFIFFHMHACPWCTW